MTVAYGTLLSQTETTFTVRQDSNVTEDIPGPDFFLVESGNQIQTIGLFSNGGKVSQKQFKRANLLFSNAPIRIANFAMLVIKADGERDSLVSKNHWITPEMAKQVKKAQPGDKFIITNIRYWIQKAPIYEAPDSLKFFILPNERRKIFKTKGGQVVTL